MAFNTLPFGLSNAPAVFQALVNDVLRDMLSLFVFVYLDDILIYSCSLQEHHTVLQHLLENKLFVKSEKCEFHATPTSFGFILSQRELRMDPTKVSAVANWLTSTNRNQLQQFSGFANFYHRFVKTTAVLHIPLLLCSAGLLRPRQPSLNCSFPLPSLPILTSLCSLLWKWTCLTLSPMNLRATYFVALPKPP